MQQYGGFGSLAAACSAARRVSAYERKADAFYCDFLAGQCLQSARSGSHLQKEKPAQGRFLGRDVIKLLCDLSPSDPSDSSKADGQQRQSAGFGDCNGCARERVASTEVPVTHVGSTA
jgi:hypothetical protein